MALMGQRAEHHHGAAEQHDSVEERGVYIERHARDDALARNAPGSAMKPDQQRKRHEQARVDHAGEKPTPPIRHGVNDQRGDGVGGDDRPARMPVAIRSDSRMTPAPTVPPTAAP